MIEDIKVTNAVTNRSVDINVRESSYALVSADFGQAKGSHQSYKYPSQVGSSLYSSNLGTRAVSIIGYVVGQNKEEISYKKSILNALINPLQMLTIRVNDEYNLDVHPTATVKYTQTEKENNEYMCKFGIDGTAFYPLFYTDNYVTQAAGVIPKFHFPLIIPESGMIFSERVTNLICSIENKGVVETGIIIKLVAKGSVKNPCIINIETQEKLKINKDMVSGESIIINTSESARSIQGTLNGETTNYLKYRSITDRSWLRLILGINHFRYQVDDGEDNIDVTFIHQDKYLEVDA